MGRLKDQNLGLSLGVALLWPIIAVNLVMEVQDGIGGEDYTAETRQNAQNRECYEADRAV